MSNIKQNFKPTGYQERALWMGEEILTLADIFPENVRAMIVGLNPAPVSVQHGHYYQGQSGQAQLRRLARAGLFAEPRGRHFEEAALTARVGFTDIVKRPTAGEGGVSAAELKHGARLLNEALAVRAVPLVICVFRHPMKALVGTDGHPGMQAQRTSWGGRVFRMPGPYAKRETAALVMAELTDYLQNP